MGSELSAAARIFWNAALGMVVGAVASLAAIGFVDLVLLLNEWLLISPRSRFMQENRALLLAATVCVPAAGGLVVGLVHHYLVPERRPHGPPDVIRAVQGMDGRVPARAGFLSALTSLVSLAAGASVGQYGPLAHLGGTLGSLVARLNRHTERSATVWVGCGVAAAISTAFNAPSRGSSSPTRSSSGTTRSARSRPSPSPPPSATSSPTSSSSARPSFGWKR